jgi:hypothetical protein
MVIITQINYLIISYDHSLFTNKHYGQITDLIKTCETNVFAALRQRRITFLIFLFMKQKEH